MFIWMQDGAGAGPSPSAHLWGRIRGSSDSAAQIASLKMTSLDCCAVHSSSAEEFKCPSEVGFRRQYPEQLATPFLAPENCKGIWVLGFDRSKTHFLYQTFQNQAAIRDHRKMENLRFLSFLEIFFNFFFCLLPFQVLFCPNKSHGRIFRGFP